MIQYFKAKEQMSQQGVRNMICDLKQKIGLQSAVVFLRTAPIPSIQMFIEMGGLKVWCEYLVTMNVLQSKKTKEEKDIQFELIEGLKSILDTNVGIDSFLREKDILRNVALLLDTEEIRMKISILHMFSVLTAHSFQGFSLVIDAINHYKLVKRESQRFLDLIRSLIGTSDSEYQIAVFMFLNCILLHCGDQTTKAFIQKEWSDLSIEDICTELRKKSCKEVVQQLDVFEKEMKATTFDLENLEDPLSITKLLSITLSGRDSYSHFTNILLNFLLFSGYEQSRQETGWKILESMVQKAIQEDGTVVPYNQREIMMEEKLLQYKKKILMLDKSLSEEKSKPKFVEKIVEKVIEKIVEVPVLSKELVTPLRSQQQSRDSPRIQSLVKNHSPSMGSPRSNTLHGSPRSRMSPHSKIIEFKENQTPKAPSFPVGPPGPPGPPGMNFLSPKKGSPKLKTRKFHFDELKSSQFNNSIFHKNKLGEQSQKMASCISTDEIVELFGTKPSVNKTPTKGTPVKRYTLEQDRLNKISLSRGTFRHLSSNDIRKAIIDRNRTVLPESVLKTLKQIIPTIDEISLLQAADPSSLCETEKFLLALDIPNLDYEIDVMLFECKLADMGNKDIRMISKCCTELQGSNVSKFLSLILGVGSLLNGRAQKGFEISSLSKLSAMKSNDQKTTLLHFIFKLIHEKEEFQDLKNLKDDCTTLIDSKLDLKSIIDEYTEISTGFNKYKDSLTDEEKKHYSDISQEYKEMSEGVQETCKLFGCEFAPLYDTMKTTLREFSERKGFDSKIMEMKNGRY